MSTNTNDTKQEYFQRRPPVILTRNGDLWSHVLSRGPFVGVSTHVLAQWTGTPTHLSTSSSGHQNICGWQTGGTDPTGMISCIIATSIVVYEDMVKKMMGSWTSSSTPAIPTRQAAAPKHRTTGRKWTDRKKRLHSSIIPNRP